ncbi:MULTISPECIES: hypothetical protein [unclassified Agrococcus]|uniref:hypothetical protein n=1 Tax=unclassified Agrococcus TaxID=2615065 RepID=UPI00360732D1
MTRRGGLHDERGAGAVLALALVAATVAAAAVALAACALVVASARVAAAADASALAAADAAAGWVDADPCARAALVAAANDAIVASCGLQGLDATVRLVDASGLPVAALAVAGPRRGEGDAS